jgi:hypothetical protein
MWPEQRGDREGKRRRGDTAAGPSAATTSCPAMQEGWGMTASPVRYELALGHWGCFFAAQCGWRRGVARAQGTVCGFVGWGCTVWETERPWPESLSPRGASGEVWI